MFVKGWMASGSKEARAACDILLILVLVLAMSSWAAIVCCGWWCGRSSGEQLSDPPSPLLLPLKYSLPFASLPLLCSLKPIEFQNEFTQKQASNDRKSGPGKTPHHTPDLQIASCPPSLALPLPTLSSHPALPTLPVSPSAPGRGRGSAEGGMERQRREGFSYPAEWILPCLSVPSVPQSSPHSPPSRPSPPSIPSLP